MDQAPFTPPRVSSKAPLPQLYQRLMPGGHQDKLRKQYFRAVSAASNSSCLSADSKVSDFLAAKIEEATTEVDYFKTYQEGIGLAAKEKKMTSEDYEAAMREVDRLAEPAINEIKVLKRQARALEEEMEENYIEEEKRRKVGTEPGLEFMEKAYSASIMSRVMTASKQKGRKFDQSNFAVMSSIIYPRNRAMEFGDELQYLFGQDDMVASDHRNGITLHKNIEQGLDMGVIAIVPTLPTSKEATVAWKCILVDETLRNEMWNSYIIPSTSKDQVQICERWSELDGKELQFLSNNRPARRVVGNPREVPSEVNARCPVELPPTLYQDTTFDAPQEIAAEDELELAASMRNAMIVSARRGDEDAKKEEHEEMRIESNRFVCDRFN
ncbi:hypothetical protein FQN57_002310 [Myotisia sp. PD_48]|nr:hypothetical protein FQN57_002310 [Myotisia sp. PD_48]